MKAYSDDLRERILKDSAEGLESWELSEKYDVSRSWVDRLKQRFRETGEISARKPTKTRPPVIAGRDEQRLMALVKTKPDATLNELRDQLALGVSRMAVWRALQRLGMTLKKKSFTPQNRLVRTSPNRERGGKKNKQASTRRRLYS